MVRLENTASPTRPGPSGSIFIPAELERSVQLVTVTSVQSPKPWFAVLREVFRMMQSSPAVMAQSLIRTRRQRSTSIPSQLGINRLLSIVIPEMCRSSQPIGWIVQVGASWMRKSASRTRLQPTRIIIRGRPSAWNWPGNSSSGFHLPRKALGTA